MLSNLQSLKLTTRLRRLVQRHTLKREVHVSNSVEQIGSLHDGLKEEYIKKGGKPAEEGE